MVCAHDQRHIAQRIIDVFQSMNRFQSSGVRCSPECRGHLRAQIQIFFEMGVDTEIDNSAKLFIFERCAILFD